MKNNTTSDDLKIAYAWFTAAVDEERVSEIMKGYRMDEFWYWFCRDLDINQ